jgi:hypothetical protein
LVYLVFTLDRAAFLVQSDSTLFSGAAMLQIDAEEMTPLVCLFKTLFGPAARRRGRLADSFASIAAQPTFDVSHLPGRLTN